MCCTVIDEIRKTGDSCGGEVTCVIRACPKGLGSPVFDKLEAELAKALMSLPASKVLLQSLADLEYPLPIMWDEIWASIEGIRSLALGI